MVTAPSTQRGSSLIFALFTLTLVALTIAAVSAEIRSRATGVVLAERSVRIAALCDAAVAESLAELDENGAEFRGIQERDIAGGTISSTVRALGEWEVELIAVGKRNDWQAIVQARISLLGGARLIWWQRTQGPATDEIPVPEDWEEF